MCKSNEPMFVNVKTVAALLGRCTKSVWRDAASGRMPPPVVVGRRSKRWNLIELRRWAEAGCPSCDIWEARDSQKVENAVKVENPPVQIAEDQVRVPQQVPAVQPAEPVVATTTTDEPGWDADAVRRWIRNDCQGPRPRQTKGCRTT